MREIALHPVFTLLCIGGALWASRQSGRMELATAFILAWLFVPILAGPYVFPGGMGDFAIMRLLDGFLFTERPITLGVVALRCSTRFDRHWAPSRSAETSCT